MSTTMEKYDVPAEAIDHYRQHGWTRIDGVLPREEALALRDRIAELVRAGTDLGPPSSTAQTAAADHAFVKSARLQDEHQMYEDPWQHDELFEGLVFSPRMVGIAKALLATDRVKHVRSIVLEKRPADEGGAETSLHQDLPMMPLDRTGSLTIWLALVDVTPEMGGLQFISGSHRYGPLGRKWSGRFSRLLDDEGLELTTPAVLRAGDATVHGDLMVHAAPPNRAAVARWGFAMSYMRDDVLYTGAPWRISDGLGLVPNEPFDHERFRTLT